MIIGYIIRCIRIIGDRRNKKLLVGAIIKRILLVNDKTIMSLNYKNQFIWSVDITIGNNSDIKMR